MWCGGQRGGQRGVNGGGQWGGQWGGSMWGQYVDPGRVNVADQCSSMHLLDTFERLVHFEHVAERCDDFSPLLARAVAIVRPRPKVRIQATSRQRWGGVGGQYIDLGPVQDQASKVKRPRSSTRAGKRSSLYVLHLAARASQCCCNSFATFSLKAVVRETVVRQAEEGLGGSIY